MNKKFTILTAALALLTILAIPIGMWGQTRAEEVYSTCLFGGSYGTSNNYASTWTATNGDYSWSVSNGNTNSTNWNYVKFGRKNTASVGTVTTSAAYDKAITKVDVTIDAIIADKVNSIKLYTSTNNSTWTEADSFTEETGVQSVVLGSPTANLYYKIEFDCASHTANGIVQVSKVEYFYDTPSSDPTLNIDPTSADSFTYVVDNGPSTSQLFEVTGTNLTESISVSVSPTTAFEISDDDTSFGTDALTLASGDVVSVRLQAGLALGDYAATLSITSTGADPVNVALSGSVTNPPTYTVTYDGNGATSGTAPTDATAYSSGATVTVLGNTGTLAKTGYTWSGWNTQADGNGTNYSAGNTFTISANTTLYAKWVANTHNIIMPGNDTYGNYTASATVDVPYGTEVTLTYTPASGYESYEATWSINGTPIAGNKFNMPDANVTVTVAVTLTQWVLTDLASLTSADVFVIVGGGAYAMTNDNGASNPPVVSAVTISGSYLTSAVEENIQWHVSGNASGYIFYPKGSATTWLYSTSSNNGIRVGTNANKLFTMDSDGYLVNSATSRYLSIYINGTTPQDWRGYTNTNNNPQVITFYKKVAGDVTINKEIDGYGIGNGKWYLIAPPVASVASTSVVGGTYDLYYFDQSQAQEWRNYKKNAFAKLESGKGYLYAHDTDTVLPFTGQPYRGNGVVTLTKTDAVDFSGWNLVGNPFNSNATIPLDYYRMNGDGDGLIATDKSNAINPMEGVFVQAATNGATLTFTPSAKGTAETINQLVINVGKVKSGDAIDRAIVRFSESNTMQKLRILEGSAEIYIPQDGVDYAIVRSEAQGEMPVNFKAAQNGSYTLSIDIDADMDYLHLIDNMTGADVDLLANPSYTFDARTSDYISRFRLVFSANDENGASTGSATFAYFNGSEWVVNSNGNATLQVVDVMGRVLSSETVNGNHTMNLNLSTGVYMLRLVNGNDVKTQKIVVR